MILVIGYGNPLCGDDGVGQYVADRLDEAESVSGPEVEILARHQLTPELVEPISRADLVIFVDAQAGGKPGLLTVTEVTHEPQAAPFTHNMTPEALLSGACVLYGRYPQGVLYTLTAASFAYGDEFSPPVQAALPALIKAIEERIAQCMNTASSSQSSQV